MPFIIIKLLSDYRSDLEYKMQVNDDDTASKLKLDLSKLLYLPSDRLKFLVEGRTWKDDETFKNLHAKNSSRVHVMISKSASEIKFSTELCKHLRSTYGEHTGKKLSEKIEEKLVEIVNTSSWDDLERYAQFLMDGKAEL